jgi:hypothetical protein
MGNRRLSLPDWSQKRKTKNEMTPVLVTNGLIATALTLATNGLPGLKLPRARIGLIFWNS